MRRFHSPRQKTLHEALYAHMQAGQPEEASYQITPSANEIIRLAAQAIEEGGTGADISVSELASEILARQIHKLRDRTMRFQISLEDRSELYAKMCPSEPEFTRKMDGLVTNFVPRALSELSHMDLLEHARASLGLRYNSYRAFQLMSFVDQAETIEVVFYADRQRGPDRIRAWMSSGNSIKYVSAESTSLLNKQVPRLGLFAGIDDARSIEILHDGVSYTQWAADQVL
ncbi:hypothetical protein A3709_20565 [Halioglobus sp. HI00S01]|nr:hypothetical protein A3709_20565 [Halioglobus sp. HI00S01]